MSDYEKNPEQNNTKNESENAVSFRRSRIRDSFSGLRNSFKRAKSMEIKNGPFPKIKLRRSATTRSMPPVEKIIEKILEKTTQAPSVDGGNLPQIEIKDDPESADLEQDLSNTLDPALLNGSSGNFGSAGARSAPSTPQGIPGAPDPQTNPGCVSPLIQRSPSHNVFTKVDKASLKLLSTSTPAMTAQGQLAEPPTHQKTVKEAKVPTTSKSRQKKFHRHFPLVDDNEKVLNYYSCALIGDILLQGHLYITKNYFAFYSNVFGYVTKLLIPMLSVEKITKEKTARIIPNAVGIATSEDKHVFGSLISRDNTFKFMVRVWELYQANAPEILVEPEIVEPVVSESDSSETREGESERESPSPLLNSRIPTINTPDKEGSITEKILENQTSFEKFRTMKRSISNLSTLPKHNLLLIATTLMLILLFFSAAILLYRIGKIQSKYSFILQPDNVNLQAGSEDIYNDLLQWQTHLHSKSAGAVHNFLDNNLDQIAKVRQSLEALSTLLMPNNNPSENGSIRPNKNS